MKYLITKILALTFAVTVALFAASEASAQATITIQNADTSGVGFNDTTPATPVGGNNGTTIGQQRLIAVQAAASIWGATLTSGPTITIRANWEAITAGCTNNGGPLASAGNSGNIWRDFSGAVPGFWYGNALANAISNQDRNGSATPEINARFNLSVGTPGCLENLSWYYGLDNNHGNNGVDLVSIALHEFAHGLGFQTFTSSTTGAQAGSQPGFPSIYDRYLFDKTTNKFWPNMTDAERVSSAINNGNLVWTGPQVTADVPSVLGTPRFRVNSPPAIAGNYTVGTADFGPRLSPSATTASVVQAQDLADGAGPSTTDGCSALTNSSAISGKIALIDRGSCSFVVKVKNAQNAGAVGVIIANNVSSPAVIQMGGSDSTITIPSLMISLADGNSVKGQLGAGVNGSLLLDTTVPGGADSQHHALLYAPSTVEQGSSVSHWDMSLFPNQLMEPSDSGDLFHSVSLPYDLTLSLMKDIGWPTNAATAFSILLEAGTANTAAAVDSVTRERGPFTVLTTHNFSADGQRRLMIFTTDLGLSLGDTTGLSVQAGGIPLQVESAGPVNGLAATSFIIVKLANLQANSTYALTVTRGGATSTNAPTIQIQ